MGLIIDVYRRSSDCTNGGISSKHDRLTLVNVPGPFEPAADMPAAMIADGHWDGDKIIVPAELDEEGYWRPVRNGIGPMMGGNFGASSDSRFAQVIGFYGAVPIHDRFETAAQYASYD